MKATTGIFLVAVCIAAAAHAARAADYTWQGGNSLREWNNTALWQRGTALPSPLFPCTGQAVEMPRNASVTIRGRSRAGDLVLSTGIRMQFPTRTTLQVKNSRPNEQWCSVSTVGPTSPPILGSTRLPAVVDVFVTRPWTMTLDASTLFQDTGDGESLALEVTFAPALYPGSATTVSFDANSRAITALFPTMQAARLEGVAGGITVTVTARNSNPQPAVQTMLLRPKPDLDVDGIDNVVLQYQSRTLFKGFGSIVVTAPAGRQITVVFVFDRIGDGQIVGGIGSKFNNTEGFPITWTCSGSVAAVNDLLSTLVFMPNHFQQNVEIQVTVTDDKGNDPVKGRVYLSNPSPFNTPPRLRYAGSSIKTDNIKFITHTKFFIDLSESFTDDDVELQGDRLTYRLVYLSSTGRVLALNDSEIANWGATLDPSTGIFAGTPLLAGGYQFRATATDLQRTSTDAYINMNVENPPPPESDKSAAKDDKQSTTDAIIGFVTTFGSMALALATWGLIQLSKQMRTRGNRHLNPLAYYVQRELGMESVGKFTSGHEYGSEAGVHFHENIREIAKEFSARVDEAAAESRRSGNPGVSKDLLEEWKSLGVEAERTVYKEDAPMLFEMMRTYGELLARAAMAIPAIKRSGPIVNMRRIKIQLFSGIEPSHFKIFRSDIVDEMLRLVFLAEEQKKLEDARRERLAREDVRMSGKSNGSGSLRQPRRAMRAATESQEILELRASQYERPPSVVSGL